MPLLVIGPCRMGLEIQAADGMGALRFFIDCAWPRSLSGRLTGRLPARFYADWCLGLMMQATTGGR